MVRIANISKRTFMEATSKALSSIKGRQVKLHELRQFVTAQFTLKNEHLIESMFEHSSTSSSPDVYALQKQPLQSAFDIGARQIAFHQLSNYFLWTRDDGWIAGSWWGDNEHLDDDFFLPISKINPCISDAEFLFRTKNDAERAFGESFMQDSRHHLIQVKDHPELSLALCEAFFFSLGSLSDAINATNELSCHFGCTPDFYQKEIARVNPSHQDFGCDYKTFLFHSLRMMFTSIFPASVYPNIERSHHVAILYAEGENVGEDVSHIPLQQRILLWSSCADDGSLSARFLFSHMTGLRQSGLFSAQKSTEDTPYDAQAVKSCIKLFECIPEWKSRLPEMAKYPAWIPYVRHWAELTDAMLMNSNLAENDLFGWSLPASGVLAKIRLQQ